MVGSSYGRVVLLLAVATTLIEFGTFKSLGILLTPIQRDLDVSLAALGTVFAMPHTICYLVAPVVGKLAQRYQCRSIIMFGGALILVAVLVCSFASSIELFATGMILTGIGFGMSYTPLVIIVVGYYPERVAAANSIIVSGAAVGMMCLPPLTEKLIRTYGWRGAMALLAAVNFHVTLAGVAARTPPSKYRQLTRHVVGAVDDDRKSVRGPSCTGAVTWLRSLPELLSLDIFSLAPMYTIHLFVFFVTGVMYSSWIIFVVPHGLARGIGSAQASFLSTAGGLGCFVSRVVHGPILDRGYLSAVGLSVGLSILNALAFFLDLVAYDNYAFLICLSALNGATLGTLAIILLPVSQEALKDELFMKGYLVSLVFFAVGEAVGGWLAGALYELTKSYLVVFATLGGLSLLNAVTLGVERMLSRN